MSETIRKFANEKSSFIFTVSKIPFLNFFSYSFSLSSFFNSSLSIVKLISYLLQSRIGFVIDNWYQRRHSSFRLFYFLIISKSSSFLSGSPFFLPQNYVFLPNFYPSQIFCFLFFSFEIFFFSILYF